MNENPKILAVKGTGKFFCDEVFLKILFFIHHERAAQGYRARHCALWVARYCQQGLAPTQGDSPHVGASPCWQYGHAGVPLPIELPNLRYKKDRQGPDSINIIGFSFRY